MVQFSLLEFLLNCENVVSFRGLRPPDPPPGASPLGPTGGIAPRPPYRLMLPPYPPPQISRSAIGSKRNGSKVIVDGLRWVWFWNRYYVRSLPDIRHQPTTEGPIKHVENRISNSEGKFIQEPVWDFIRPQRFVSFNMTNYDIFDSVDLKSSINSGLSFTSFIVHRPHEQSHGK